MRVAEERDLCAHARRFRAQTRQVVLDAEEMSVREKKAHAGKLRHDRLRGLRAEVAVSPDHIKIRGAQRVGKVLRVRHMVSQMDDHVRLFDLRRLEHRAERAVRVGQYKNFHRWFTFHRLTHILS